MADAPLDSCRSVARAIVLTALLIAPTARAQSAAASADAVAPTAPPAASPTASTLMAASAFAPTSAPQPFRQKVPAPATRWYGAPALILDGATMGLLLGGLAARQAAVVPVSMLVYLASAPINHVAHGHGVQALRSLGLRAAPLLAAGLIIARTEGHEESSSDAVVVADALVLVGVPVIMLIDDLVIARERVPVPDGVPAAPPSHPAIERQFTWSPQVSPLRGGGWTLGAVGRF